MFEETSDLTDKISLRPIKLPEDEPFLKRLYFSIRQEDFNTWETLGKEQAEHLKEMQFAAQTRQYKQNFPDAKQSIILFEGKPIGRSLWTRMEGEVRGIDLAVLSEYQNLGAGTSVLKSWMDEAAQTNRILTFHVLKTNHNAIRLYLRLELEIVGESSSHYAVEWRPSE